MNSIDDAHYISQHIGERLLAKGLVRAPLTLERYRQGGEDADSKLVYLNRGKHGYVVTVSPREFPEIVAEECARAAVMRLRLGALAGPVLHPIDTGRIEASTFAVLPHCAPLSRHRLLRRIARIQVRRHLLDWLLHVAQQCNAPCETLRYEQAIKALTGLASSEGPTAKLIRMAEPQLQSGRFVARSVPMHGDLWWGNVLRGATFSKFTLIDWRGSMAEGYPVFDLVRAAQSFALSARSLATQLQRHRAALGCQTEDLAVDLTGALGHYAANLGEMQPQLFLTMADECGRRFLQALETGISSRPVRRRLFGATLGSRSAMIWPGLVSCVTLLGSNCVSTLPIC